WIQTFACGVPVPSSMTVPLIETAEVSVMSWVVLPLTPMSVALSNETAPYQQMAYPLGSEMYSGYVTVGTVMLKCPAPSGWLTPIQVQQVAPVPPVYTVMPTLATAATALFVTVPLRVTPVVSVRFWVVFPLTPMSVALSNETA